MNQEAIIPSEIELELRKKFQTYFLENVVGGPGEYRVYAYESFVEQVTAAGLDPVQVQEDMIVNLLPGQVEALAWELPKGLRVRIRSKAEQRVLTVDELRSASEFADDMKAQTKFIRDEGGNEIPVSRDQADALISYFQSRPYNAKFPGEIAGTVVAEPIQGYSENPLDIRMITDDGEEISYPCSNVEEFVVTGVSQDLKQRRPREIYSQMPISIWNNDLQAWVTGRVKTRLYADTLRVTLDQPISVKTILGEDVEVDYLDVQVGRISSSKVTFDGSSLPQLGSASFEKSPHLYQNIDLTGEQTETPYERIPAEFRPGALIMFPNGTIGKVMRSSEQGMAEVEGVRMKDKVAVPNTSVSSMQWIDLEEDTFPQLLHEEPYRDASEKIKGKRVQIDLDTGMEIRAVVGVFSQGNQPIVVLESLPAWSGGMANIGTRKFLSMGLESFNGMLLSKKAILGDQSAASQLRQHFPEQYESLLANVDDSGSVSVNMDLQNGERISRTKIFLHSLPFGVWFVSDKDGDNIPRLHPLSEIRNLEVLKV